MKITDLIKAAKEFVVTPEYIEAMEQRVIKAEERFEKEAEARRFKSEDYNFSYSI